MSKPFTDTPWHGDGRMILSETADSIVAMVATGAEDRDFIIQAVNAHAGLVERVKQLENWHTNIVGAISTAKQFGLSHVTVPHEYLGVIGEDVTNAGLVNAGLVEALKMIQGIASGSTTANSLPNLERIAGDALAALEQK